MPNIAWIDEQQAGGALAEVYGQYLAEHPERPRVPDILKCFSQRPDFLRSVIAFSYSLHFSDGHLTRRTKEMIATQVSGLNKCPY
ncbi:MAG TPA: carboxymuconolactone decarboxylase family protein [Pirellulales bacterium]|nr:carboxymuconolactone decarboxylase family protein [Pirellulales bacterium]